MTCLVCDKPLEQRGDRWVCDGDGHKHVALVDDDWGDE